MAPQVAHTLPPCYSTSVDRGAGVISVQTSPNGYIAWGVKMHSPLNKFGVWYVEVHVNRKMYDQKLRGRLKRWLFSKKALRAYAVNTQIQHR
jgi:hypothetical protein